MDKDTDQATTPRRDCMREQIVGELSPSPLASSPQKLQRVANSAGEKAGQANPLADVAWPTLR